MYNNRVNHISIKLLMNEDHGIRQLDFTKPAAVQVPTAGGNASNMQLTGEFFDWGIGGNMYVCKLFILNKGSEDIMFKLNPRDDRDPSTTTVLDTNESRDLDFHNINCIKSINIKVNGPGTTTVIIEAYAFAQAV